MIAPPLAASSALMARINAMSAEAFTGAFADLFEHSPWAAARAFACGPFADAEGLGSALENAIVKANPEEQRALIRAHPELAGARVQTLTAHSAREQGGMGLDRLAPEEQQEWDDFNAAYRARFGFPFVICVRAHTKAEILAEMKRRLGADAAQEEREALNQIALIARFRLAGALAALETGEHRG